MPTILHLDLDAFFASVEEVLNPALRGKVVIVGGSPTGRGIVACPNYAARKLGVKTAMPASRAVKLAPHAVFVRGNYDQYSAFSKRFFKILNDFSPAVKPVGLDEGFLDARGCLHFWNNDVETMARAIKDRVKKELGLAVSIGVASNTIVAKVASDARKPDGLCIVADGEEKEFLAPMPAGAIPGIGKVTSEALAALGVNTVHDLAQIDESLLRRVFGVGGGFMYRAARGEAGHDRLEDSTMHGFGEAGEIQKSISRDRTFEADTDDPGFIRGALWQLSEHVASTLRKDHAAARTITIKLRYSDMHTVQRSKTLCEATDSEFAIFECVDALLEQAWFRRTRIRLIGVGAGNLQEEWAQFDLFNTRRTKQLLLGRSLDRIRKKFGEKSVWFGIVRI